MGRIPWNKGLTQETDERIKSYSRKGFYHSKETIEHLRKISDDYWKTHDAPNKGKTNIERYGIEKAAEMSKNISLALTGKTKLFSDESSKRKSIAHLKRIEQQKINGVGDKEESILKMLEEIYDIKLIRQFFVLGYRIDGFDMKNNTAYEIDESFHYDYKGELREYDKTRQQKIEEELDCKFIRIEGGDFDAEMLSLYDTM